mgnify:CR=1 FL=1
MKEDNNQQPQPQPQQGDQNVSINTNRIERKSLNNPTTNK